MKYPCDDCELNKDGACPDVVICTALENWLAKRKRTKSDKNVFITNPEEVDENVELPEFDKN